MEMDKVDKIGFFYVLSLFVGLILLIAPMMYLAIKSNESTIIPTDCEKITVQEYIEKQFPLTCLDYYKEHREDWE